MISDQSPRLEFAVQVWSSKKKIDIDLSYETRLKRWGIDRLEDRLVRGRLVRIYPDRVDLALSKYGHNFH